HHRVVEVFGRKDVGEGLFRKVLVIGVSASERRDGAHELVTQSQWVSLAAAVIGEDLLQKPILRKILHIHRHWLTVAGMQSTVEAKVGDDEIRFSIAGKITGNDAVPPAVALLEGGNGHLHQLS